MGRMQRLRETKRWLRRVHRQVKVAHGRVSQWQRQLRFRQGVLVGRRSQQ